MHLHGLMHRVLLLLLLLLLLGLGLELLLLLLLLLVLLLRLLQPLEQLPQNCSLTFTQHLIEVLLRHLQGLHYEIAGIDALLSCSVTMQIDAERLRCRQGAIAAASGCV